MDEEVVSHLEPKGSNLISDTQGVVMEGGESEASHSMDSIGKEAAHGKS